LQLGRRRQSVGAHRRPAARSARAASAHLQPAARTALDQGPRGLMSKPPSKTFTILTGPTGDEAAVEPHVRADWWLLLQSADAILMPKWFWKEKEYWRGRFGKPVYEFLDFIKPDSNEDYAMFQWYCCLVTTLQNRLTPLIVEDVSLAHA